MATGTLKVEILTEGIHSGEGSGLVSPPFLPSPPGGGPPAVCAARARPAAGEPRYTCAPP